MWRCPAPTTPTDWWCIESFFGNVRWQDDLRTRNTHHDERMKQHPDFHSRYTHSTRIGWTYEGKQRRYGRIETAIFLRSTFLIEISCLNECQRTIWRIEDDHSRNIDNYSQRKGRQLEYDIG
ncbi:PREDICTED: uncharacterized protein LOC108547357 [Eufriesea mexicana]|uniref:uncharacterized protein LOC108547357 n=1 Tax=Eufriesea mexicana TaxID=516756 RepID=UPI00083BB52A|nr:PREDICTED: uncharacterized protein LOC108547357 [Eufriesea mexicana]XP_017755338.1 PREDICTED: uncharacterized protein LOC108547357 [Eufriesea mexicana]